MNTPTRLRSCPRLAALILAGSIATLLSSHPAQAASGTWLNTGVADGLWSTTSNWGSGTVPGAITGTTNADTAAFNSAVGTFGTSGSPVVIDAGRNLRSITFTAAAGSYTLGTTGGTPLLLTGGGTIQFSGLTATNAIETINAPLTLQGSSYTVTNNSISGSGVGSGTFNFGGAISSAAFMTLTLSGSNTNANTISGVIGNGASTGFSIMKSGTGTWVLSGVNTFNGFYATIFGGTLSVNSIADSGVPSALGQGGGIALTGGKLQFTGASGGSSNRYLNPAANADSVIENTVAGQTLTFSGAYYSNSHISSVAAANHTLGFTGAGNFVTSGNLTDSVGVGHMAKTGAGTWTISGINTYAGQTTITGGTVKLANPKALGLGGNATTATGVTTVSGASVLDLNGTTGIQEPITLSGAGLGGNGVLVNSSGTAASIGNGIAGLAVPALGIGSGLSAAPSVGISGTGASATASASLGLTTASITSVSGGTGWVTGDTVSFSASVNAVGVVTASGGAITGITITSAGRGFFSAPTSFSRLTGSGSNTGVAFVGNSSNFTVGGLTVANAGTGYTGTPTFTIGGVAAPAVTATLSSVNLATASSIGGSGNTTIAAVVSGAALSKVGAGTLTLTGANTYTGNTAVTEGKLTLSGGGSFASSPDIAIGSGATLDVSGVTSGASWDGTRFAVVSGQTLHGTGTVLGALDVSAGGTIAPGNSIGTLAVSGLSLTSANSVFELEIDLGLTPAADLLNVTGGISLASSTLDLSLFNLSPMGLPMTFLFAANDLGDAVTGTFGTITGVPEGYTAVVDYDFLGTDALGRSGDGNDLAITFDVAPVPEPGTAVFGLVLAGLSAGLRRRTRRCAPASQA